MRGFDDFMEYCLFHLTDLKMVSSLAGSTISCFSKKIIPLEGNIATSLVVEAAKI
jgi:hypothetical protein